jgi:hypothetical protein
MTSHLTHEDLPEADDPAASTLIASLHQADRDSYLVDSADRHLRLQDQKTGRFWIFRLFDTGKAAPLL